MSSKATRGLAVAASTALILGAFIAGPAEAKKKCAKYAAPDWAGDAETSTVTDKATADAPVEVEIMTLPGAGFTNADYPGDETGAVSHAFHNVVVDTKAKTARLFVTVEYAPVFDYDLFLRFPAGFSAAYEADFNPVPGGLGSTSGGSAAPGLSSIDGFTSPDCTGYTVDVASSIGGGGPATMKLWLEK